MRKLLYLALLLAMAFSLTLSAAAQGKDNAKSRRHSAAQAREAHGKSRAHDHADTAPLRSKNGGEMRGRERASEVRQMNEEKRT